MALLLGASAALGFHALSPGRYVALDAASKALIPLDRDRVPASALAAAQRACNRLDRADPLLAPLGRQCSDVVSGVRRVTTLDRCGSRKGCLRASVRLRQSLASYVRNARSANRAIDASVPDPACRVALRTSAQELGQVKRLASVLRLLERALKTGSTADLRRAEKRFDTINDSGPSAEQERDRFRRACA